MNQMNILLFIAFSQLWTALAYPTGIWSDPDTLSPIDAKGVNSDLETERRRQECVEQMQTLYWQNHCSQFYFKDVHFESGCQTPQTNPVGMEQGSPDEVPVPSKMRHEPDISSIASSADSKYCNGLHARASPCQGITLCEAITLGLSCCRIPCAAFLGCTVSVSKCMYCSMGMACWPCCSGQAWEDCKEKGVCDHLYQTICKPGLNCFRWAAGSDHLKEIIRKMRYKEGIQSDHH